jgi:hypothetical protein
MDIVQQMAFLGIDQNIHGTIDLPDGYLRGTHPLGTASGVYIFALDQEFIDAIGFQPLAVHQMLDAGTAPDNLNLFRGGLDIDALPGIWRPNGYGERRGAMGTTIWILGEEGELDFTNPIQRRMIGALNNATIVDDVVIFGSSFAIVEEAVATHASGQGSILSDPVIAELQAAIPATTVSAIAIATEDMRLSPTVTDEQVADAASAFAASDTEFGPMPAPRAMWIGITAGLSVEPEVSSEATPLPDPDVAAGEGLVVVRIAGASAEDAEAIAATIEHRWHAWTSMSKRIPFTEIMDVHSISAIGNVAAIDFVPLLSPSAWFDLVEAQDVLPFLPALPTE